MSKFGHGNGNWSKMKDLLYLFWTITFFTIDKDSPISWSYFIVIQINRSIQINLKNGIKISKA
jgi:hypothetical protein